MTIVLIVHLLAVGVWIGVVGAEWVIERDGTASPEANLRAASMHAVTDRWIELPALLVILATGLLMLHERHFEGLFLYKLIFAMLAILFNLICVYAVFKRKECLQIDDAKGLARAGRYMLISAGVIPSFILAIGLGIYIAGTG
ncbi:hypothetical protein [Parahaliea mediterranea]|uniref:Uncharacterized protein n=1 Tax=Parahaliea mediterranea TaxID=651086 RepID=A0A939IIJ1_9GAMM|nr:hypothetical protein [Parahaliea mediterranea]MBN7796664.1 hypothetical protein [Parahaliea mediterranea]